MKNLTSPPHKIVKHLENNQLTRSIIEMLPGTKGFHSDKALFELNFNFFVFRTLKVSYPCVSIHQRLLDGKYFKRETCLLGDTKPETGIILLPAPITVVHSTGEKLKITGVLYSWLSHSEHFRYAGLDMNKIDKCVPGKSLLILPMDSDRFIPEEETNHLYCCDRDYGIRRIFSSPYSDIQNYVMSFILFNAYRKVYDHTLFDSKIRRGKYHYAENLIEVAE